MLSKRCFKDKSSFGFAFSTTGMDAFLKHMKANNVSYHCSKLPHFGTKLINIYDYDGKIIRKTNNCTKKIDFVDKSQYLCAFL